MFKTDVWRKVLAVGLAVGMPIASLQAQSPPELALIRQQVAELGLAADVKLKLTDGKELRGNIQAIAEQSFRLAPKGTGASETIAYDQVSRLNLADLYYKAKGTPDPTEARRTVVGLGLGKHVLVRYGNNRKVRGTIEAIEADHFTLVPHHQSASLQISYDDTWQVQPNRSRTAKILIAVGTYFAFIIVLAVLVNEDRPEDQKALAR